MRKREVFGWAMYDFANSGYTTVVMTAVFNAYFVGVVAGGADWATLAWTLALGAVEPDRDAHDAGARRLRRPARREEAPAADRPPPAASLRTAALALRRAAATCALAVAAIVLSNLFYAYGESLTAAFLPELARREALGRVSGWGWSFGYFGGMLTLGLSLAYVIWAQGAGPAGDAVRAGDDADHRGGLRAGVAARPSLLLRERALPQPASRAAGAPSRCARLRADLARGAPLPRLRAGCWSARVFYQAGIAVVIALAAIYAEQVLGFKQAQTMMLIFLVNIAAALGAFAFGYVAGPHRPQARAGASRWSAGS